MPRPKDHAGKDFVARHATTTKTGAVPRDYKPFRDRLVPTIHTVACPDCRAARGDHCVRPDGTIITTAHRARRRMALRTLNHQED